MEGQRQGQRMRCDGDGGGMGLSGFSMVWRLLRAAPLLFMPALLLAPPATAAFAQQTATVTGLQTGSVTGLPVPRYVSLKTNRVNLREGPSMDHATTWVFQR